MTTPSSPEALRAQILANPNTAEIAKAVDMSLDEYVDQVLEYALNPDADPMLLMIKDEDLRKLGCEVHTLEEMLLYLEESLKLAEINETTDFSSSSPKKLSVDIGADPVGHEPAPEVKGRADLKEEIKKKNLRIGKI